MFIMTCRTSFVAWLIKLIVRCFSHFAIPLTLGRVMNTDMFIYAGKQPSLYIKFHKCVSSVRPASPAATIISVYMSSGHGTFFIGITFRANSTSICVIGDKSFFVLISGIFPLLSLYNSLIYRCHIARILSFSIMMLPSPSSIHVVTPPFCSLSVTSLI